MFSTCLNYNIKISLTTELIEFSILRKSNDGFKLFIFSFKSWNGFRLFLCPSKKCTINFFGMNGNPPKFDSILTKIRQKQLGLIRGLQICGF